MPYPIDTMVPASLLHILKVRVGARRGARLLHDHLDNPDDVVTKAELAFAAGAAITISRGIGRRTPKGYAQNVSVGYATKINGRAWDGTSVVVPALPDTLVSGIVGRAIGEVIDDPHVGHGRITSVEENPEGSEIHVQDEMFAMRHVRPGRIVRLTADMRRWLRHRRLARRLGQHYGFRLWTAPAAALGAVCITLILLLMFVMPAEMMKSPHQDAIATAVLALGAPIGFAACLWFLVYMVDMNGETAVKEHARQSVTAAARDGLSAGRIE